MGAGSCRPGLGVHNASRVPAGHRLQVVPRLECHASSQGRCPRDGSCQASSQSASEVIGPTTPHSGGGRTWGRTVGSWGHLETGHHSQKTSAASTSLFHSAPHVIRICHFTVTLTRLKVPSLSPISCIELFFRTACETAPELSRSWMLQLFSSELCQCPHCRSCLFPLSREDTEQDSVGPAGQVPPLPLELLALGWLRRPCCGEVTCPAASRSPVT